METRARFQRLPYEAWLDLQPDGDGKEVGTATSRSGARAIWNPVEVVMPIIGDATAHGVGTRKA